MIDHCIRRTLILTFLLLGAPFLAAEELPRLSGTGDRGNVRAAEGLTRRLLPDQAGSFTFESIPPAGGRDVFEIESHEGRIVIRGNSGVSMATGLNWYLEHRCLCHVSWCGRHLDLPQPLPQVHPKVRRISWARHRYFLNYCCFGYSLPWWDWADWERLIDWMALNGVTMPLSVTGQEAVWQAVCRRLGMKEKEIAGFLAGPPYLPFQWMGCLDGWGGPLPATWIERHEELEKKILARERELGMTPVLQGFTGHVPPAVAALFPDAKLQEIQWIEWRTFLLDPFDPLFQKIGDLFMEEQTRRFGTDHYYAADAFIEMTPPSGDPDDLARLSRAIHDGMTGVDPRAIWVFQTWPFLNRQQFWTQPRIKAFLGAIPDESLLALDLWCEERPQWSRTRAFHGKPWLWCNVQNFGCNVHLGGAMSRIALDLPAARRNADSGRLSGLGFVNEGLGFNPAVFDLMFEMAWRDEPVDLEAWIVDYAASRYGKADSRAAAAWRILGDTVYRAPFRTRSIIDRAPTLAPHGRAPYGNNRLAAAWGHLLQAADELGGRDTYRFDLVNVARQVLSNHAAELHRDVAAAQVAADAAAFEKASRRFLDLISELDELLATRPEFLLGRWLEDARRWGDTDQERSRMEWNARRVLTLWGATPRLNDYARKEWAGMLGSYYLPRWELFLEAVARALDGGEPLDAKPLDEKITAWTKAWAGRREPLAARPRGDSVAVALKLWEKYEGSFEPNVVSLTTDKPVSCSHALPSCPARLANDGWFDSTDSYWATDVARHPGEAWWQVDLEERLTVGRVVVVGYYGDRRHYGFLVETSLDGRTWNIAADCRDNKKLATREGHVCPFEPRPVRYIRVTQTHNSANTGRHLVEVMAFSR